MLSDLLLLEIYYGSNESALFFEDLSKSYGLQTIHRAFRSGHITGRRIACGPDCGRRLFWLTEEGRAAASKSL